MASPKNSGDALFEAIQDAVNKQDFSALQSSIERSVAEAANAIRGHHAPGAGSGSSHAAKARLPKRARNSSQSRRGSS